MSTISQTSRAPSYTCWMSGVPSLFTSTACTRWPVVPHSRCGWFCCEPSSRWPPPAADWLLPPQDVAYAKAKAKSAKRADRRMSAGTLAEPFEMVEGRRGRKFDHLYVVTYVHDRGAEEDLDDHLHHARAEREAEGPARAHARSGRRLHPRRH